MNTVGRWDDIVGIQIDDLGRIWVYGLVVTGDGAASVVRTRHERLDHEALLSEIECPN